MRPLGIGKLGAALHRPQDQARGDHDAARHARQEIESSQPGRGEAAGVDPDHRVFGRRRGAQWIERSEEHTSELQSLMRISYAVFCLKKKKSNTTQYNTQTPT